MVQLTSREGKDTIQQLEKRKEKSKEVKIQFDNLQFTSFKVLDDEGKAKYFGKIDIEKSVKDECSCDSFFYGMKFEKLADSEKIESRYMAENGTSFQCKHVLRAKELRLQK